MNKVIIMALSVFVALGLTACAVEDNGNPQPVYYEQTENFSAAEQTRVVTLTDMVGLAEIDEIAADWVTITPLPNSGNEPTQVEIAVAENATGAERTMMQVIKINPWKFNLTINQGTSHIDNPSEDVTDQPAYAPGK